MSAPTPKRTRQDRVASVAVSPGLWARITVLVQRRDVTLRIGLCLIAALMLWGVTGAWAPAFSFRSGYIPPRDIVAAVKFRMDDPDRTEARRRQRRSETICIYQHDKRPLMEMRRALKDRIFQLIRADELGRLEPKFWFEFDADQPLIEEERQNLFDRARVALAGDLELTKFEEVVQQAFAGLEEDGLLEKLEHSLEDGSQSALMVHPIGNDDFMHRVEIADVRIAEAGPALKRRITEGFQKAGLSEEGGQAVPQLVNRWLTTKGLPITLTLNEVASNAARQEAVAKVPMQTREFNVGDRLAIGGKPLDQQDLNLLRVEHETQLRAMTWGHRLRYSLADLGMYVAVFVLCGAYVFFHNRSVLSDIRKFTSLLAFGVITVVLCWWMSGDQWRAEIIPLTIFGITVAIAHDRELALLVSAVTALVVAFSLGQGLAEFVILVASVSVAVLLLSRVRSRTKLIYVGCCAGLVSTLTTIGVGTLAGQSFGLSNTATIALPGGISWSPETSFAAALITGSAWFGFCSVLAGVLMTGLLPFIEKIFDVQTDLSLLELGDAAHPLLQELARRAPGTYNHSINVASIAEAAAEAIDANGLLVRVGAYFHDIGKMLKPAYFIENQGQSPNMHDSLMPAMSTLVIIAHVKDGADLARQHHLPQAIIDFIEQHHGTTLVEYFYRQASQQNEDDPDGAEVDETSFRYPGPKPQTREAGVMMLADSAESASRTLVDPAPARIESLVHELQMKKLLDGQFEECGLTLEELAIVEDSIVKSLTAFYHGRVKYPDQQSA